MAHTRHPGIWEAEAGEKQLKVILGHGKFETSPNSVGFYLESVKKTSPATQGK